MDRAAIFIDGAYLDYVLRDEFRAARSRIDYQLLADRLTPVERLLRTYYYHCLPYQSTQPTEEENERFGKMQRFLTGLARLPRFEVRSGKLAFRGRNQAGDPIFVQKRVDILLGVDLVLLAAKQAIGEAVLIAGDSDFVPAVQIARNEGVLVRLYHGTRHRPHNELWELCDERHTIDRRFIDSVTREPLFLEPQDLGDSE